MLGLCLILLCFTSPTYAPPRAQQACKIAPSCTTRGVSISQQQQPQTQEQGILLLFYTITSEYNSASMSDKSGETARPTQNTNCQLDFSGLAAFFAQLCTCRWNCLCRRRANGIALEKSTFENDLIKLPSFVENTLELLDLKWRSTSALI